MPRRGQPQSENSLRNSLDSSEKCAERGWANKKKITRAAIIANVAQQAVYTAARYRQILKKRRALSIKAGAVEDSRRKDKRDAANWHVRQNMARMEEEKEAATPSTPYKSAWRT